MSCYLLNIIILLTLIFTFEYQVHSIPTCIIVDSDMLNKNENGPSTKTNYSTSLLLRNLRMLDEQRSSVSPELVIDPVPLSYIDLKKTTISPAIDINYASLKRSLTNANPEQTYSSCSLNLLTEIETQMVVPFEFRRLRVEQPDHYRKYLDDDPRESVPHLSTAVYERRSDPYGPYFCRKCHDGNWNQLSVCETIKCDAELLRGNPRLVTEWGEIKSLDGGALYSPSSVFAIYAFAFGPHCKRCELNGQWSRYALPELCSGIRFFGHPRKSTTTMSTSIRSQSTNDISSIKQTTMTITTATTASMKLMSKNP